MGDYKLSNKCESDIVNIYEYGIEKYGLKSAQEYIIGLQKLFQTLADHVNIGRDASEFFPSLKRFSHKSHTIFYLESASGAFIVRTLGQSMDYSSHLL